MQAGSTPQIEDKFADLSGPNAEDLSYDIARLVEAGALTPEQAQAALVDSSAMSGVMSDPTSRKAMFDALAELQNVTEQGGMTAMDRASMNEIFGQTDRKAKGARDAVVQNMEARGMGGSGASMLAQLQANQDAAQEANARGLGVASAAQQRALEAMMNQGNLASSINAQDFNQQSAKAQAQDAISKFNAQNQQQVNLANTAAANRAQELNLANKQDISNKNADLQTQQNKQKADIAQQMYDNELKKRTGQQSVSTDNATNAGADSARRANATNRTIGTGLSMAAMLSDERQKEDIEDFDAGAFLDSLTSKKFKYKDEQYGKGQQAGIMAQDLLKTPEGSSAVMDTPEGLMVDSRKAANLALSSAADLNKRLKKLEGK